MSSIVISGDTSGAITVEAPAVAGTTTLTLPATSGTFVTADGSGNSTVSGNLTLSGGTANGVLYLNGSKVATSGSALVFDGTNLGIGTSSPSVKLDVADGGNTVLALRSTSSGSPAYYIEAAGGGTPSIVYKSSQNLRFATADDSAYTNYTERARIDSSGRFLVTASGTGQGDGKLYSYGVNGSYAAMSLENNSTSSQYLATFFNPNGFVGSITTNGSSVGFNTSSDYRLKDNPQPLTNSGAFIDALKPKTWEWKADGSKGVGFIAHEVSEVSPGSVVGEKDAVDAEGKPVMQAMEYGSAEFIANIVAELQSLRARIAALENK